MKTTTRNGIAALLLLLAISCKKENSSIQTSSIKSNSSAENGIIEDKVLAKNSVRIGTQVWMKINLKTKFYRNGDPIPQVTDPTAWASLTTGAWCWYNNDSARYGQTYGKLYNWYAVNDPRGLAPEGWHIPSDSEWTTLTTYLGGYIVSGGKMKSTGTINAGTGLWRAPNTDATNSSGFTGLPGSFRHSWGTFGNIGFGACWWSSTKYDVDYAWARALDYNYGSLSIGADQEKAGYSVRCVKD